MKYYLAGIVVIIETAIILFILEFIDLRWLLTVTITGLTIHFILDMFGVE